MNLRYMPAAYGVLGAVFGVGPWPSWVGEIANGVSGVYVIRRKDDKRVLYVGESHTGRLRKTLLRHFQSWSGKTAGQTYNRADVEIAILKVSPGKAVSMQDRLIVALQPRDNSVSPAGPLKDENPF